jgi:hypothetical protein
MKKIYILAYSAMFATSALFAQSNKRIQTPMSVKNMHNQLEKKYSTGFENLISNQADVPPSAFARGTAKAMGFTNYDLQTNGSMKPRIVNLGGGKVAASFTFGTGDFPKGVPDRGTGYNTNASGAFLPEPTKRIENVRTGFTNLCLDADGTEYTFAHTALSVGYRIVMNKKTKGTTTWKQTNVPVINEKAGLGGIWPSVAIGGSNGKSIHMVALNDTDTAYNKMSGPAILYSRSLDGGVTWDKVGIALPGIDEKNYLKMSGDSYAVASKGNTVAIAYFGRWEDSNVWISQDNGNTWTKKTVYKFPLPLYKTDTGYDVTKFPATDESAEGSIFTTDEAGSIFIDNKGKVHIIAGRTYVSDTDLTDKNTNFSQGTNGFVHWDETFAPDSLQYVEAWADKDGDNAVTLQTNALFGTYFHSATCWPSTAVAADGTIYVVYSAPDEKRFNADGDLYRSIFIIKTTNNGKTWSKPYDIISNKKYYDNKTANIEAEFSECTFPSVAALIDNNKLHITYQVDDSQELHVQGYDSTPAIEVSDNYINYVDVDVADIVATEEVVAPSAFNFEIAPNPAHDEIRLSYNLEDVSDVKVTLTDLTGRVVTSAKLGRQTAGATTYNMTVNTVAGLYFVQLNINGQIATQKVVIK